jgi:hypothetical protein
MSQDALVMHDGSRDAVTGLNDGIERVASFVYLLDTSWMREEDV